MLDRSAPAVERNAPVAAPRPPGEHLARRLQAPGDDPKEVLEMRCWSWLTSRILLIAAALVIGVHMNYDAFEQGSRGPSAGGPGSHRAERMLGFRLIYGETPDLARGAALLERAARAGDVAAQRGFAELLADGRGVEQDAAAARVWYRKAAESDDATSACVLAQLYERGEGGPVDAREAALWYARAVALGHHHAEHLSCPFYGHGAALAGLVLLCLAALLAVRAHPSHFHETKTSRFGLERRRLWLGLAAVWLPVATIHLLSTTGFACETLPRHAEIAFWIGLTALYYRDRGLAWRGLYRGALLSVIPTTLVIAAVNTAGSFEVELSQLAWWACVSSGVAIGAYCCGRGGARAATLAGVFFAGMWTLQSVTGDLCLEAPDAFAQLIVPVLAFAPLAGFAGEALARARG